MSFQKLWRSLTTPSRLKKGFAKGVQMGDARTSYSQAVQSEASAERIGHLVCSQSSLKKGAVGYGFVSTIHSAATQWRLSCCFPSEPLAWVCNWEISSVLHSPSVSNLEGFKHVVTKQRAFIWTWKKCCRADFQSMLLQSEHKESSKSAK